MADFSKPSRSGDFVLIGDSGEKDPEIYALLARRHPGQVSRILIRNVAHRPLDFARARRVFDNLPGVQWQAFEEPAELPEIL